MTSMNISLFSDVDGSPNENDDSDTAADSPVVDQPGGEPDSPPPAMVPAPRP